MKKKLDIGKKRYKGRRSKVIPTSEGLILANRFFFFCDESLSLENRRTFFASNLVKPIMKYKKSIFHPACMNSGFPFISYIATKTKISLDSHRFFFFYYRRCFGVFNVHLVIDLWACFENDFDECVPLSDGMKNIFSSGCFNFEMNFTPIPSLHLILDKSSSTSLLIHPLFLLRNSE